MIIWKAVYKVVLEAHARKSILQTADGHLRADLLSLTHFSAILFPVVVIFGKESNTL